ncbi:cytochrome P450 [Umezawaea sp. Da 62-37]|uniref:cytochrome P450 n=1 Tax=Umezawaea sp. Da 62-37 TaxID=3075927 RepID=UPI0028F6E3A5|nr:cytochrome P450 [Umezawaea sp. Da 62-37]WNV82594.1 cytochrome P450 [Umezawaea sp. Da 62-37]
MTEAPSKPTTGPLPTARAEGCPFDPAAGFTELREKDPIARVECPAGMDAWLVTRYDDVRTVLSSSGLSSAVPVMAHADSNADFSQPINPGSIIQTDGEVHSRLRRLLTAEFTVKRIQALRPYIQKLIDDHIDAMLAGGDSADLVRDFALPIPSLVICELLGVPYEQRDQFQRQSAILTSVDVDPELSQRAIGEIQQFVGQLVVSKMQAPADDLISRLIARANESGQPLSVEELVVLALSLLVAGHETTANMIALSTATLLRNPDQLDELRANPELVPSAVEEMLRYLSVVQFGLFRAITEDIPLGDETLRAGEFLITSLASGNRDTSVFPDADALDVKRKASAHLAFGYGAHQCLGQQLARVELQQVFGTLFTRIPTLRLATPFEDLKFKDDTLVYGVRSLPVAWDAQN